MERGALVTSSGVELVELVELRNVTFKDVAAELERRDADPRAADALIDGHATGRLPSWLVAHLLGCARAPQGYDVARAILLAAPGQLAESYAGPAMARIAGVAAYEDLRALMFEAPRLSSREGAAYGLMVLEQSNTAGLMLHAWQAGRVRRHTAAFIVAGLSDMVPTLLDWFTSDDPVTEALAFEAASTVATRSDGAVDAALAAAIRRAIDGGRVKLAPRTRAALLLRIAPILDRR